jgi:hypothetical protein
MATIGDGYAADPWASWVRRTDRPDPGGAEMSRDFPARRPLCHQELTFTEHCSTVQPTLRAQK